MSGKNYYSLVAGLREYAPDSDAKGLDIASLRDDIADGLTPEDRRAVRLLYGCYDCENLVNLHYGSTAFNALGNFTREELAAECADPKHLPARMAAVVRAYADPEGEDAEEVDVTERFEKNLFEAYYKECAESKSRFLREWSEFDRTLRNILAASVARAAQQPVESVLVGEGDAVAQMRRSSAADFGLRGEYEFADAVVAAVNDERNILEKERKIDMVRWSQAEELSVFDYFNVDAVLAWLARVNIVARWSLLDPARGREMFDRLMAGMEGGAALDALK